MRLTVLSGTYIYFGIELAVSVSSRRSSEISEFGAMVALEGTAS